MATVVTKVPRVFPASTVVSVYVASTVIQGIKPSGSALKTATVEANGTLEVTGLEANTEYFLVAEVSGEWRYVLIGTATVPSAPSVGSGGVTTVTLKPSERYPIGTSVSIYPARNPAGRPSGSSVVEAQTVDATGTLKFEGLEPNTEYQLAAQVGGVWRYMRVSTSEWVEPPTGLIERVEVQRAAVGA